MFKENNYFKRRSYKEKAVFVQHGEMPFWLYYIRRAVIGYFLIVNSFRKWQPNSDWSDRGKECGLREEEKRWVMSLRMAVMDIALRVPPLLISAPPWYPRSKIGHIPIVSTDLSQIFSKHPVDLLLYVVDCEQSLFFFRFSKGSAHLCECWVAEKRGRQPKKKKERLLA